MSSLNELIIDKAMRTIAAMVAAGRLKTVATGVENIPTCGPALIVARHYHHLYDGLALFATLPRPFHVVVALDWVRDPRVRWFMETINRIARWPVLLRADALRRADNSKNLFSPDDVLHFWRKALREASELLIENRIVVIFPEGYPNIDPTYTPKTLDEFLPFKPGLINIVRSAERKLERKIPILPAGLHYTMGKHWVGYVEYGAPIYRKDFYRSVELMQYLERRIKVLSGLTPA